jgi:hypothetical protein
MRLLQDGVSPKRILVCTFRWVHYRVNVHRRTWPEVAGGHFWRSVSETAVAGDAMSDPKVTCPQCGSTDINTTPTSGGFKGIGRGSNLPESRPGPPQHACRTCEQIWQDGEK